MFIRSAFRVIQDTECDLIEMDVQLSKDNEVVFFHDDELHRTSNGSGLLRDFTLSELKQLDVGSWFSSDFKDEKTPTLDETLAWAKDKIWLSIEVKNIVHSKDILVQKTVQLT